MDELHPPAVVHDADAAAVAALCELEVVADGQEADASDTRWEQAEHVVELLDRGWTQQAVADVWKRPDGTTYSREHVKFVAKTWRIFRYLGTKDRPRWNDAYHSPEVRGKGTVSDDEWYTPGWLFDALGLTFELDVCSPLDRAHVSTPAARHYTEADDGLAQDWTGLVWCNPPYSSAAPWAARMIEHGHGVLLAHVPVNGGWCMDVWRAADRLTLFQGMHFVRPDGGLRRPAWWLQLAAFGDTAGAALDGLHDQLPDDLEPRWRPGPIWGSRL